MLMVFQCLSCKHILSDSSFLVAQEKGIVVKDVKAALGDTKEGSFAVNEVKYKDVICVCGTVVGAFIVSAVGDKSEYTNNYLLHKQKISRCLVGGGPAAKSIAELNKLFKTIEEMNGEIGNSAIKNSMQIAKLTEVIAYYLKDPELVNLLQSFMDFPSD